MPALPQHRSKRASTRRICAGALLAVPAVVGAIVSQTGSAPSKHDTGGKDSAANATTVMRRDLVQTDAESGTLSYASPHTVYNRLSGTVTWLPSVGQVIRSGEALFKVDGKPVILMHGTTPAYRELTASGSAGQDVLELNRNLVALGFNPEGIVVDDEWQAATTAGVEALQASLGDAETGSLALGRIVFLPGDQLVSTVDATLGSTGGGSGQGNPSSSTSASDPLDRATPKFVSFQKPTAPRHGSSHAPGAGNGGHKPPRSNSRRTLGALIALLKAEIGELKATKPAPGDSPSRAGNPSSNGGNPRPPASGNPSSSSGNPSSNSPSQSGDSGGGSASPILQTTSTRKIVTVALDPSKQSEAKVGERVTVEMPAGNMVDGRVSSVSPVAQSSSNSGSANSPDSSSGNNSNSSNLGSTIPVTITLSRRHPGGGLDQAAVSVDFARARANHVLSVPVTALLATAGGGYAVQSVAAAHQLIPVTAGLFAAGYVQISGRGIYPGLRVTDSQG